MRLAPEFDAALLSRIEDAGINASAPPQQRWVDGWLLRYSPGKAKRARCVNAVAAGRLPIEHRLAQCEAVFRQAGLPMVVRITPFSQPTDLDDRLAMLGMPTLDDTRVMVLASLDGLVSDDAEPPRSIFPTGWQLEALPANDFAETIGSLRGSPRAQRSAHAQRLVWSPVPYSGFVLRDAQNRVAACGQLAIEADLVGLYDVFTAEAQRGRGLAGALCRHLLLLARTQGARTAYLQVEGDNQAARAVYQRLGFADGYGYHYRSSEPDAR